MSEYSDKTSANKLFGSSPGYVGYEKGGILTSAVAEKPFSIVLLDEFEKAHSSVHQALLPVLDEGRMTDNKGQEISFKNTIIILTSNVGCHKASAKSKINKIGFSEQEEVKTIEYKETIDKEIKKTFPPEFINRIDDIVLFNSLNDNELIKIIGLELNIIGKRLK
jgi:ATP-dependent Clp protease ATP-binding subunit ClpA